MQSFLIFLCRLSLFLFAVVKNIPKKMSQEIPATQPPAVDQDEVVSDVEATAQPQEQEQEAPAAKKARVEKSDSDVGQKRKRTRAIKYDVKAIALWADEIDELIDCLAALPKKTVRVDSTMFQKLIQSRKALRAYAAEKTEFDAKLIVAAINRVKDLLDACSVPEAVVEIQSVCGAVWERVKSQYENVRAGIIYALYDPSAARAKPVQPVQA
jgi:hypothetical protein